MNLSVLSIFNVIHAESPLLVGSRSVFCGSSLGEQYVINLSGQRIRSAQQSRFIVHVDLSSQEIVYKNSSRLILLDNG